MLRIHEVTSATDAKRYYAASDYYQQGQETVGQWGGKLAKEWGLTSTVNKAAFDRLCDNLHPFTGEQLTLRNNDFRRVGYDVTFSGPKSFSIAWAFASEDERRLMLADFDAAVRDTMAEIEADMRTRVRKDGEDFDRVTGNMVWAEYDHTTARPVAKDAANDNRELGVAANENFPPDMHIHKHVFAFNATKDGVERCLKAGQFGDIKRDGEYFTAVFYSHLANRLTARGYVIDRRGGKDWEIAGVPDSAIATFSKRTGQVEKEHEARLKNDPDYRPGNKHELGAKTRGRKQKELTPDELRRAWDAQLSDDDRDALAVVYGKEMPLARQVSAGECVAFAIAHCSERESVVPERELKRVALLHGLGSVTPEMIAAELSRQGVLTAEIDDRRMATTRELQAEENAIVGFAAKGRGAVQPVGLADGLERGHLNDGQWQSVCGLLNSGSRVNLVEGPAGAGKSTMLQKFDEGMRAAGQSVTYLATTTDAAGVLSKDGFEVSTVARFLLDEKLQNGAKGGRVVIDESSMLGHKDAYRLFRLAETLDAKLILVGDPMQHGSVPRGATMRILKDYGGIRPFRLTEIMRQERPDYREAARLLSEGDTLAGFDAIDGMGWIKEIGDDDRYSQIAADYLQAVQDNKSVLAVSPTHAESALVTKAIRDALRADGKLGAEERAFTKLVAANATEAERGQGLTYRPGDVLVFHQNAKGFKKGERFTVADPATVPLAEADKFQLYRQEPVAFAAGDRIRFTATVKTLDGKHKLNNGTVKTVAGFDRQGNIHLDNGWVVSKDAGHFRHGFVETSFGSQGKTVQRVILAVSSQSLPATNQEQIYVSSTRAKEKMTIYTDDKTAIRQAAKRSSSKLAAIDLRAGKRSEQAEASERLHQQRERRKRLNFYQRLRAAWAAASRTLLRTTDRLADRGDERGMRA